MPPDRCKPVARLLSAALLPLLLSYAAFAEPPDLVSKRDPHYNEAGFFDIHVCNWPKRPLFFLTLFSTTRYAELSKVEVFGPMGTRIGEIPLQRFRLLKRKGKPDKRVFITELELGPDTSDGWYTARATFRDGRSFDAKDYVVVQRMELVGNVSPAPDSEVDVPQALSWDAIPGAKFYQVYIRDLWNDGKLIHTSKLLDTPRFVPPPGLLQPDGLYRWRVHARDTNGNVLLGDFNHGTTSGEFEFSTRAAQ